MCGQTATIAVVEEVAAETPDVEPTNEVRFYCQDEVDKIAEDLLAGAIPVAEFFDKVENARVLCDA